MFPSQLSCFHSICNAVERGQGVNQDAIVLNPPFERGEDAAHVLHAYKFLAPEGILAAIVSDGVFARRDKKETAFRHFLVASHADIVGLPADAFKPSGTGVRCRMIRIQQAPSTPDVIR